MKADPIPYCPQVFDDSEMLRRAQAFEAEMDTRRSVRHFSDRAVPRELIEAAIRTASTAPSGAHRQPWKFVAVSNHELKKTIRVEVEAEEHLSYTKRMSQEWKDALRPIGTDWQKPYLETVPWVVAVFEEVFAEDQQGRHKNYYVKESVGNVKESGQELINDIPGVKEVSEVKEQINKVKNITNITKITK